MPTASPSSSPSGNDFQPDLSFRGFTASPLLGTPQGLSVFQDGVRINEAFADVVHWDLLPQNAIASMQLLPGSNPIFGFNTLGGALALNMKDGFRYGGAGVEAYAGSFGRTFLAADAGGTQGPIGYFVAGEALEEQGWRDHSRTRIGRAVRPRRLAQRRGRRRRGIHVRRQQPQRNAGAAVVDAVRSEAALHVARHHGEPIGLRQL